MGPAPEPGSKPRTEIKPLNEILDHLVSNSTGKSIVFLVQEFVDRLFTWQNGTQADLDIFRDFLELFALRLQKRDCRARRQLNQNERRLQTSRQVEREHLENKEQKESQLQTISIRSI